MNPLLQRLTSPEWTHVVGALLHSLWQAAIIAIALAVPMRRLASPVMRYRCALISLGLIVIAGLVTWAVLNAPKPAVSVATQIPVFESAATPITTSALNPDSADKVVAFGKMFPQSAPPYWIAWLALVWMLGASAMLLRAGIKVAGAENLRRSCQPLNDERMLALVAEARRAVGLVRRIRIAVTDKLTSPAVVGVIVPTLILPLSLFTALTPEQIRFVLLHELAHIRRGDYFANLFQLFAEALLFFNPALWWISHQIRREREACCDALAIELSGAPADYARTLVLVAENILQPATSAALAFGDRQREPSSLTDRVQRLLIPGYRPALRLTWRAMLASLLVGGALLFLSAVGARNVVGAVTSDATETLASPAGNANSTNSNLKQTGKLAVINTPPPQINIKVQWVKISPSLTNSMLREFLTNTLSSQISRTQSLSGVLTEAQMAAVRKRIDLRDDMFLLSEGDVTTLIDRQAQILTVKLMTIVTGINPNALTSPGVNSETNTLETQDMEFGPILDVLPTVSGVDSKISLRIVATLNEFLGYDKAKSNVTIYINGKRGETTLPLPKFRLQQMTNDWVIPDTQTLVFGDLPTAEVAKQPNGEILTKDVTASKTNSLLVFVTPTLIDSAGNRVHPAGKSPPGSSLNSK